MISRSLKSKLKASIQADCGRAVRDFMKESGTPRSEICYVTKVRRIRDTSVMINADTFSVTKLRDNSTERHAAEAIQQSLDYAGLDYLDLCAHSSFRHRLKLTTADLIHGPYPDKTARLASWDAISKAVEQGKIRSAGVSNYGIRHLKELNEHTKATGCFVKTPAVNQIDLHPFMQRREDVKYNEEQGIVLMAWGPLARGMRFDNATLKKVAEGCGKSPAQVLVRWGLQKVRFVCADSAVWPLMTAHRASWSSPKARPRRASVRTPTSSTLSSRLKMSRRWMAWKSACTVCPCCRYHRAQTVQISRHRLGALSSTRYDTG